MRIQNIYALFYKQIKDVLKNLPVLVLFIVYPCIAAVMINAMKDQPGTGTMFLSIFATMHCVFTPIVATSSVIAEEKELNTLRVLIMSNVTLREYLISIGGFIFLATLLTGSTFLCFQPLSVERSLVFLGAMAVGSLISVVLGMCIGLLSKNAAAANGLAVPFGMVFAFLPMLANFNKGMEAVSRFIYGQQISYLFSGKHITFFGIIILCINFAILLVVSALLFRRSVADE